MLRYVCLAVTVLGAVHSAEDIPRRCCFDKQYSVTLGDIGAISVGTPTMLYPLYGSIGMAFDYYQKMSGTTSHFRRPDGVFETSYELKDYENRVVYKSTDNITCTYEPMDPDEILFDSCIPDNATFMGNAVFGFGHNSLAVNSWHMLYPVANGTTREIIMSVTVDSCVPVAEAVMGTFNGHKTVQTLFFTGYHPGIDAQYALKRPVGCIPITNPTNLIPSVGRR